MSYRIIATLSILLLGCLQQPVEQTATTRAPASIPPTKEEMQEMERIIDPCGFLLPTAINVWFQKHKDYNFKNDPEWIRYSEKTRVYIAKIRSGHTPPESDRCGGGDGPPLPPGFTEPPPGVTAKIICLGEEDCQKYHKKDKK
jgi:hypothetical protein